MDKRQKGLLIGFALTLLIILPLFSLLLTLFLGP